MGVIFSLERFASPVNLGEIGVFFALSWKLRIDFKLGGIIEPLYRVLIGPPTRFRDVSGGDYHMEMIKRNTGQMRNDILIARIIAGDIDTFRHLIGIGIADRIKHSIFKDHIITSALRKSY